LFLLPFTGCQESPEATLNEYVNLNSDIADTLATVKDKPTAEAALPKLREYFSRLRSSEERLKSIKASSKSGTIAVKQELMEELEKAESKMARAIDRIQSNPEAWEVIKELFEKKTKEATP
jgi:viroplasmin and RNaseH domain-containing protein